MLPKITDGALSTKSPAFQWYPKDFLSDANVMAMTLEERGAYITLLSVCWMEVSLPADVERLARICGVSTSDMERVWQEIKHCFRFDQTSLRFTHPRLDEEREKQRTFSLKKSAAGRSGGKQKHLNASKAKVLLDVCQDFSLAKPSSASASASALKREEYSELEVRADESKLPVSALKAEELKTPNPQRQPSPIHESEWFAFRERWGEHSTRAATDEQWSIAHGIFRRLDSQQKLDAIAGVETKAAVDDWRVTRGVPNNYLSSKVWTLKDKTPTPSKTPTKAPHAMIIPSWEEVSAEKARAFQRETERNRGIFWHEDEEASGTETHRAS